MDDLTMGGGEFRFTRGRALMRVGNEEFCRRIADLLMIQADGGDDPAAVVAWAIRKAYADLSAEAAQQRAKKLLDQANSL